MRMRWKRLFVALFLVLSMTGCAICNGKVFLGWGRYKDKDFEIESSPPLKDIVSINAVGK